MADQRDKVLSIVKMKGPLLPHVIAKDIGTNILFASAMLSELVDNKLLKLTRLKAGGSPLYYAPGQEDKLQSFSHYLGEKERRAYELLAQQKIVRDIVQEPLTRACLRELKDFAVPLTVGHGGKTETFWKWYLLSNGEAERMIKPILGIKEPQAEAAQKQAEKEATSEKRTFPPLTEKQKEKIIPRAEKQKKERGESVLDKKDHQPEHQPELKDKFYLKIRKYFEENKIMVTKYNVVRKNADIEFLIGIPSSVGKLEYFCKAKNKKNISDADLSSTYLQSQKRNLPILFLTTGELTKKAKAIAETEFKNMTVKQI